jgi:signal transduction histidine kinase
MTTLRIKRDRMAAVPTESEERLLATRRTTNGEQPRVNDASNQFLSFLRHEFGQPLTVIQGFSELIRDDQLSIAEIKEYAALINKEAAHLAQMISRIRDMEHAPEGAQRWQEFW